MRIKRLTFLCSCIWFIHGTAIGQGGGVVKYGNDFLNIGVSARAFGMGNTHIAVTDDVSAGYWNPAGLVHTSFSANPEVALMHASYFANIATYNHLAVSLPIESSGARRFGVSIIRIGVDDIPNTLSLVQEDGSFDYDAVSGFSASDFAAIFSYAWKTGFIEGLSLGINFKIIYRGAGNFGNAWGFGADLGAKYERQGFVAGMVLRDATYTFNAWTFNTEIFQEAFINTGNAIPQNSILRVPPSLRLGIGQNVKLNNRLRLLLSMDTDIFFDGKRASSLVKGGAVSIDPKMGAELSYLDTQRLPLAFFRVGFYNLQNEKDLDGEDTVGLFPTTGVGFVIKNFQLDYALANIGNLSENLHSHVISLKFRIE